MLLLHIAAILPFATCQFLSLPSSYSSETDAPIENMECIEGCTMPFLDSASTYGTPSMSQLCDGFIEMKECLLGCPGGAEMMTMVAGMVPQSFKLVTEMCEGEGTMGTVRPDLLSGVLNEAAGMEQLDGCVTGCERNLQTLMITGPDALPGLDSMCQAWDKYSQCVAGCPNGAEVVTTVQNMMPKVFKTIEDACGPISAGPSGTEEILDDPNQPIPENQFLLSQMDDPVSGAPGVQLGWASLIGCLVLVLYSRQ